jgi:jumonji domain-containing protein 7
LRDQFPGLFDEVPPAMELAIEAFGNEPEAVNIWIGDERAVSTMHKDHYEAGIVLTTVRCVLRI